MSHTTTKITQTITNYYFETTTWAQLPLRYIYNQLLPLRHYRLILLDILRLNYYFDTTVYY